MSRLTVSFNRVQILKFSCLAEFGLRKGSQMVNTVLEDQKLLIQYLSNISWSHSFTKYKPFSIMHFSERNIKKDEVNRRPLVSGDTNLGIMTLEVMQCAHWLLCTCAVRTLCTLVVVQCAHWLCSVHIGCCAARTLCTLVASDCQRVTLPALVGNN